jgi:YD repeat-containing protein
MDIVAGGAGGTREGCPGCKEKETLSGEVDRGQESWKYDSRGNMVEQTDGKGYKTTHEYDGLGRKTETEKERIGSTRSKTAYTCDDNSNLTKVKDDDNNETSFDRIERDWDQHTLAEKVGLSQLFIARIERVAGELISKSPHPPDSRFFSLDYWEGPFC